MDPGQIDLSQLPPEALQMLLKAMAGGQNGGLEMELGAYDAMGPEGFKQLSNMGTLDERGALAAQESKAQQDMVAQQLAQMQKFSEPRGQNYGSVAGNVLGGLGDIVRQVGGGIASGRMMKNQQELAAKGLADQTALLDRKDAGRVASGTAQMEAARPVASGTAQMEAARKFMEKLQMGQQPRGPSMAGGGASPFGLPPLQFDPYGY